MRRELSGEFELDDDPARVDLDELHRDGSPYADRKWLLHTGDAHGLYEKIGFGAPSERLMERE